MEKYFIEENGKKRESTEKEVKTVVQNNNNPDKMVVESKDEKGDTTIKVLTRLMG